MNKLLPSPADITKIDLNNAKQMFDLLDCSENTKADYKARVGDFIKHLSADGLTKKSLLDYKKSLANNNKISVATKNKQLITAKRLLQIMFNAGIIPFDASKDITGRGIKGFHQSTKHKKRGLKSDEVFKICEYMQDSQDYRLKAILSLLIYQGLRRIEIVRLDVNDFNANNLTLMIKGKGKDDKEPIRLHQQTATAISQYLKSTQLKTGALFVSQSNNQAGSRLTEVSLYRLVKGLLNKLKIANSTHGFRHRFITDLIDKGFTLMQVKKVSRHSNIEMLNTYYDEVKDIEIVDEMLGSVDYQLV
ncbi:MAG: tyrosine-type recombinase/integrase [Thaumarchaeota archaeon]|nr:tyrosine-type recombinase/integrase [Nitrososphaerota archaeon]